ncbi:MAG: Hpt domain-containing protein [Hyphomicrobiaceae bacterium]
MAIVASTRGPQRRQREPKTVDLGDAVGETVAQPAIDRAHLSRYTLADAELEREILALFAEQAQHLRRELASAATPEAWTFATHSLKGACRAIGAFTAGACAERLERVGLDGCTPNLVDDLDSALAAALAEIS